MWSLLSVACFSGLNTDPDAFGLCDVSCASGFVGFEVWIDVMPVPVTVTVASSSMVPIVNGVHILKSFNTCFVLVR